MAHLIDKDALVAEIERLFEKADKSLGEYRNGAQHTLISINDFLDTLEVKEVDLKKELNEFIEQQKAWIKNDRVVEYNNGDSFNHIYDLEDIAKHFFELGLKAQKGE